MRESAFRPVPTRPVRTGHTPGHANSCLGTHLTVPLRSAYVPGHIIDFAPVSAAVQGPFAKHCVPSPLVGRHKKVSSRPQPSRLVPQLSAPPGRIVGADRGPHGTPPALLIWARPGRRPGNYAEPDRCTYMPLIKLDQVGGLMISWPSIRLTMLVEPGVECWLVLYGRPVRRCQIPVC